MLMNDNEYLKIVSSITDEIKSAQFRATVRVNQELIMLYHSIGTVINSRKSWGNKFVENLAADIKRSFPGTTGYSVRNLKYMAKFAATYPNKEFVQQTVAQIHGDTMLSSWIRFQTQMLVCGISKRAKEMDGHGMCWCTKSKVICIPDK